MTEPPLVSQLLGLLLVVVFCYGIGRLVCWLVGDEW